MFWVFVDVFVILVFGGQVLLVRVRDVVVDELLRVSCADAVSA